MADPRNPYAPPSTQVADSGEPRDPNARETLVPFGRVRPAGRGAGWIGDAWRLLKAQPGMWIIAMLVIMAAYIVLSMIPLVNIFTQLLGPFVTAGIALCADEQRRTGTFEVKTLMGGFSKAPVSLLAVAGVTLLCFIVLFVVVLVIVGFDVLKPAILGQQIDPSVIFSLKNLLLVLICVALALPVVAATYLAPPLIVLHDQPALTAMHMSLVAMFKNILAGLVSGLCWLGLIIVAVIPLGLGLLVLIPLGIITNYTIYRDIFVEENAA
jgi:uncharacterized membrane protein